MRIIPKFEIYTESKSSLVGMCAVRFYHDGNITFSKQSVDLMNLQENNLLQLCDDTTDKIYLMPNKIEGFKVAKRKMKNVYLCSSKHIVNYLSKRLDKPISSGKPLEFLVKKSNKKIEGCLIFELVFQDYAVKQ